MDEDGVMLWGGQFKVMAGNWGGQFKVMAGNIHASCNHF